MSESITYPTVIPYLILRDSDKFISFAKNVFDAEELNVFRKEDGSILHAEIKIGNSVIMMGEAGEQFPVQTAGLYVSVAHADTNFDRALQNGARVVNPLQNKEYGRTCGVKDPFGNTWWITSGLTSK